MNVKTSNLSKINFPRKKGVKYARYIRKILYSSYGLSTTKIDDTNPMICTVVTAVILKKEDCQDKAGKITMYNIIFRRGSLLYK